MVFVIAEIGINHNGSIEIAKKLIDIAASAGCDAVKFQKRNVEKLYPKKTLDQPRESPWGTTQREQKMGLEFSVKDYTIIDKYCKKKNISWFASCWDVGSQIQMRKFKTKYNKVASAMLIHEKLLETIAEEEKYTFISTGMSTIKQIENAVKIFNKFKCPFELMHTHSSYPMKIDEANLKLIQTLKNKFKCKVGYSGHETGSYLVSVTASLLGATSIERHITLDRSMYGSDQSASIEPAGVRQLVGAVRKIEIAMGDGIKKFSEAEKIISKNLRQHL